ncbi:MAG: hypothetical protein R3C59_28325 [Planctomycetaceae bacterium]
MNVIKEFKGGENHFENFLDGCVSRNVADLNADVREGHLSAAISHLGNISYYMGQDNKVTVDELATALKDVKSLDDNQATLQRTVTHLERNKVDLQKYPISLGPQLQFDPEKELFTNNSRRQRSSDPRVSRTLCLPHRRQSVSQSKARDAPQARSN